MAQTQGPKAQCHQDPHTNSHSFHPLAAAALPCQARAPGHTKRCPLECITRLAPSPWVSSPAAIQLHPQGPAGPKAHHSRAMSKPFISQLGIHTAPKPRPARLCRAHPHAHAHTGIPPYPTRLSTYLRRRLEGREPARVSRFSPHPAAVESHGPPPAPITKQHNNRLSEFR